MLPNILIFMTDQQRGDVIFDDSRNRAQTPRLDAFRQQGLTFSQTYCPSPHCCPSRATFFTGQFPSRHGVWNNVNVGNALSREPFPDIPFWSEALLHAGYRLGFSGKWHISDHEGPEMKGWECSYVTAAPRHSRQKGPVTREWELYEESGKLSPLCGSHRKSGEIIRPGYPVYRHYGTMENPFGDEDVVEAGIRQFTENASHDHPWCQFIGTLGPHDPYCVPREFLDLYSTEDIALPSSFSDLMEDKPAFYRKSRRVFEQLSEDEHREAIRHYLAFCSYEDSLFGRVLDALDESGQVENTLVLFLSDHGDYMGEHGLWCKGLPAFLSAYHVPAVLRWPNGITDPGRTVEALVSLADFAPTFYELIASENPLPSDSPGISLFPWLKNDQSVKWRDSLCFQTNGNELYGIQRSILTEEWRFVWNTFDEVELYYLPEDPDQTRNLASLPEHQACIRELMNRLWKFAREQDDVCINPYIAIAQAPVGPGIIFYE